MSSSYVNPLDHTACLTTDGSYVTMGGQVALLRLDFLICKTMMIKLLDILCLDLYCDGRLKTSNEIVTKTTKQQKQ